MVSRTRTQRKSDALVEEQQAAEPVELSEESLQQKREEMWEVVREEQYEVVEQLPLSLHRTAALMKEQEMKAHECSHAIPHAFQDYIGIRRAIDRKLRNKSKLSIPDEAPRNITAVSETDQAEAGPSEHMNGETTTLSEGQSDDIEIDPHASRRAIQRLMRLASDWVRAAEDKYSLAEAAYNTADRHCRSLDVSLKESSNPYASDPTLGHQPITTTEVDTSGGITLGIVTAADNPEDRRLSRKEKDRLRHQRRKEQKLMEAAAKAAQSAAANRAVAVVQIDIDPNEPRYCICNNYSYGQMIACDNSKCEKQWFHMACLGLTGPPKGKWYCSDCASKPPARRRR